MKNIIIFLGVIVNMANCYVEECDLNRFVDGCSISMPSSFLYGFALKPACNRHDICYKCGYTYNITKAECDDQFHSNMWQICLEGAVFWKNQCQEDADQYYEALEKRSHEIYIVRNVEECKVYWVPACLKYV